MTKKGLLQLITQRFEQALNEGYEGFGISYIRRGDDLTVNIGGAYEGYKASSSELFVKLEEKPGAEIDGYVMLSTDPTPRADKNISDYQDQLKAKRKRRK